MIESEFARNGQPVLKLNGCYLASSFDPIKEAFAWANRASVDIGNKGSAIIIGAGCGYHIAALKEKCPNIQVLAIELHASIAAKALEWNPILSTNNLIVEADPVKLTDAPQLRDAMAGSYAILPHLPTTEANREWALAMARFLLGRDKLSFLLQLRMRPELHSLLNTNKIAAMGEEPVSIKTLQKLFADTQSNGRANSRERQIWRVLEELVL